LLYSKASGCLPRHLRSSLQKIQGPSSNSRAGGSRSVECTPDSLLSTIEGNGRAGLQNTTTKSLGQVDCKTLLPECQFDTHLQNPL
jgi:hypothetical protein